MLKVKKITKYEIDDCHDVEFIPAGTGVHEVFVDGIFIETLDGDRPSEEKAIFYYQSYCTQMNTAMRGSVRSQEIH